MIRANLIVNFKWYQRYMPKCIKVKQRILSMNKKVRDNSDISACIESEEYIEESTENQNG